jgi:hypothetical protein
MAVRISLTLDATSPSRLGRFWKLALGYEDEPPPAPFRTREERFASFGAGDDEADEDYAYLHDPSGAGPRLSILQVPEPKTAKNRLHLDVRVSGGERRPNDGPGSSRRSTS